MDGADHLNDDRPSGSRRRRVVVLLAVVVVVAGLGIARVAQLDPGRSSEVNRSSSVAPPPPTLIRPAEVAVPRGTLVVAAAGKINTVDLGSGAARSTAVPFDPERGSMAAVDDGAVVAPGGAAKARLLVAGGSALVPTPRALTSNNRLVAGTDSSVWASRVDGPAARSTWRLADLEGHVEATVRATAPVISDGSGGLFEVGRRTFRQLYPAPSGPRLKGTVLGVGRDGYMVRPCADPDCADPLDLYTRATNTYAKLPFTLPAAATGGVLSSNNRFVALTEQDGEEHRLEVRSMTDGSVLRSFPQTTADEAVWLDQRWLALVSSDQLVLYDAVGNSSRTPRLDLDDIGALAWIPT